MVGLKRKIWRLMMAVGIWWMRRKGLQIGRNWALAGFPIFGSEPYLITIGDDVAMAAEVALITHDGGTHVFRRQDRYRKVIKFGHIHIKDNCVIGYRAIILPGVTIGPNSVIAAGSVVSRSIPPNVLAGGNPARPLMSVERYAEWSLAGTPDYDADEYRRDKRSVLSRLPIRGARKPG